MSYPKNLKYTKDHEWISLQGNIATIGITGFAVGQLGDIVYLDLPKVNAKFDHGASIGTVESTKTVSDIFTPVQGSVTDINTTLQDSPETLSKDPYTEGWLVKMKFDKLDESELMNSEQYEKYLTEG